MKYYEINYYINDNVIVHRERPIQTALVAAETLQSAIFKFEQMYEGCYCVGAQLSSNED